MHRRSAVLLGVFFLLLLPPGHAAAAADDPVAPVTTPEGFDSSAFRIEVFENGSARWTIQHSRPLENRTERLEFEDFASRFNTGDPALVRQFRNRSRYLVANVSNSLGREMTAKNFRHRAHIQELGGTRGIVELSYTWTNFARVGDDTVVVGDVFEGGIYIFENQRLVVSHGPNLRFAEASPDPTSTSVQGNLTASETVTWQGERQFSDNRPLVRLADPATARAMAAESGTGDGTTTRSGNGSDGTETPVGAGSGPGAEFLALLVVLIVGLGLGLAWYADVLPPGSGERGEPADPPATAGDPGDGGSARMQAAAPAEPAVSEEEMLSDEDRVRALLEDNGGRMKQVKIVEETDWSKSKVSMLLSDMEEEGEISKLRVGRENIISIAGQEPEAAGSPFEEE